MTALLLLVAAVALVLLVALLWSLVTLQRAVTRARQLGDDRLEVLRQEVDESLGRRLTALEAPKVEIDPVALYQAIESLPAHVLRTIQGSINPQQGKIAELLAYAELRYDYDQIIPLGKPVDFIGIKYTTNDSSDPEYNVDGPNGRIDFLEIKSGKSVMTAAERQIKALIESNQVRFRVVRITDESVKVVEALA